MAKILKQTYLIKDNGVNGEGGTRQAARMKEEDEGIEWRSEEEEGTRQAKTKESNGAQRKKKEEDWKSGIEGGPR